MSDLTVRQLRPIRGIAVEVVVHGRDLGHELLYLRRLVGLSKG